MKISRCLGASLRLTEITCAVTRGEEGRGGKGVVALGDARPPVNPMQSCADRCS